MGSNVTLSSRLIGSIPDSSTNKRIIKHKIHHTIKVNIQGLSNDLSNKQDDTVASEESVVKKTKV